MKRGSNNHSLTRIRRENIALEKRRPECPWCKTPITKHVPDNRIDRCLHCLKPIVVQLSNRRAANSVIVKKPLLIIHHLYRGRTPCPYSDRHGVPGDWPIPEDPLFSPINIWSESWDEVTCPTCRASNTRRKPTLSYGDACEGPLFQQSHTHQSRVPVSEIPRAEIIVGPRYRAQDVRPAAQGTFVLEVDSAKWRKETSTEAQISKAVPEPISGPIVRCPIYENAAQTEAGKPASWNTYCDRCLENSRPYKRKNELALWQWAHRHRCKTTPPQPSGL